MLSTFEKILLICVSKYFHELSGIGIVADKSIHEIDSYQFEPLSYFCRLTGHFDGICSLNCSFATMKELAELMFEDEDDFEIDEEMINETGMELLNTVLGRTIGQLSREDIIVKMAPPTFKESHNYIQSEFNLIMPFKTKFGYLNITLQSETKYT